MRRLFHTLSCVFLVLMMTSLSATAQTFSKESVTGYWYNKKARRFYYPGDTIRLRRIQPVTIQALFDSCGTDSNFVDLWRYTERNELITTLRYIDPKTHQATEQKVLYYPCEIMPSDSTFIIPTKKFIKRYKVIYFDGKNMRLVFREVLKKESDTESKP
ncbi:MAG: hypothetical protein H6585_12355 [Flavobacteriales bacterium]|nr:hypothetical protein [Flavobacteriales bacterium]MCB9449122.1 hypothetical protein [Flavobacteriales bacterium]